MSTPCCPGGPIAGHIFWCASVQAEKIRAMGAAQPTASEQSAESDATLTGDYEATEAAHEQYQDTDPDAPYYDGPDVPPEVDPALSCHGCGAYQIRARIARAGYVKPTSRPEEKGTST